MQSIQIDTARHLPSSPPSGTTGPMAHGAGTRSRPQVPEVKPWDSYALAVKANRHWSIKHGPKRTNMSDGGRRKMTRDALFFIYPLDKQQVDKLKRNGLEALLLRKLRDTKAENNTEPSRPLSLEAPGVRPAWA